MAVLVWGTCKFLAALGSGCIKADCCVASIPESWVATLLASPALLTNSEQRQRLACSHASLDVLPTVTFVSEISQLHSVACTQASFFAKSTSSITVRRSSIIVSKCLAIRCRCCTLLVVFFLSDFPLTAFTSYNETAAFSLVQNLQMCSIQLKQQCSTVRTISFKYTSSYSLHNYDPLKTLVLRM